jgi:hypothetical protein
VDPKALVRMYQERRPVSAGAHIDPWPDPGTIHIDPDVYFEASALLEGEQKIILPSADSEQAVAPKIFSFSPLLLVLPSPDTLECDLKHGEGVEPKQYDAAQRPARLKPPDHVAEDSDEAGGAWRESPCHLGTPSPPLQSKWATSRRRTRAR